MIFVCFARFVAAMKSKNWAVVRLWTNRANLAKFSLVKFTLRICLHLQ